MRGLIQEIWGVPQDRISPLYPLQDKADGARTKNGKHSLRKYGLLAPEELEGGSANAGDQVRGAGHWVIRGMPARERKKRGTPACWGSARPGWGGPLAPLPAQCLRVLLGWGSPLLLHPATTRLGHALPCLGSPSDPSG